MTLVKRYGFGQTVAALFAIWTGGQYVDHHGVSRSCNSRASAQISRVVEDPTEQSSHRQEHRKARKCRHLEPISLIIPIMEPSMARLHRLGRWDSDIFLVARRVESAPCGERMSASC